ncbi:MAG TPA: septum formation initiator family protein [Rhizomicrobium sp.]|jgi:cell division protein FtsB|nr:septum formation initiator family protein [Rhizomicrobium sp.]
MRIRRSVTRIFAAMVLPAVCGAVSAYFGYYAIWGERGALALEDTSAELGIRKDQLAQIRDKRVRLEHRIELMKSGDPDMIEELYRKELLEGAPNQVAVPRKPD